MPTRTKMAQLLDEMDARAFTTSIPEIERLVMYCRDNHGGFQHGNYVGFCPECVASVVLDSETLVVQSGRDKLGE